MFHTAVKQAACAAEDELGHKIRRPPGGLTQRHAESEKIFGVHLFNKLV
jgi:hypothetical protein